MVPYTGVYIFTCMYSTVLSTVNGVLVVIVVFASYVAYSFGARRFWGCSKREGEASEQDTTHTRQIPL